MDSQDRAIISADASYDLENIDYNNIILSFEKTIETDDDAHIEETKKLDNIIDSDDETIF